MWRLQALLKGERASKASTKYKSLIQTDLDGAQKA